LKVVFVQADISDHKPHEFRFPNVHVSAAERTVWTVVMVKFEPREHSIRADLGRLKEARDFAERAAADFGLDGTALYDVKLAMSEAVTNAIQHGSSSPNDRIKIVVAVERGALVFEVFDTGSFRPRLVRRDDFAESGRGLEVMRVLMDEVDLRLSDNGTLMRFKKRLAA
jgi:anti-sigma regulatory factor (Ser/Thr protein kinase)